MLHSTDSSYMIFTKMIQTFFQVFLWVCLLQYIDSSHWLAATQDKCQFTLNTERMIFFTDNPSLFVNSFKKKDLAECRSACCSHDTCNGYVWDALETDNCRLLRCSKKGDDCKAALKPSNTVTIGEVGFITGLTDESIIIATTTSSTQKPFYSTSSVDPLALLKRLQSSGGKPPTAAKKLPVSKTNTAVQRPVRKKDITNKTSQLLSSTKEWTTRQPSPKSPESSLVTVLSLSNDKHEHTNNISLTIALLFGIAFCVTILYMLGKRWVEGIKEQHTRGYTRISYLLNGV